MARSYATGVIAGSLSVGVIALPGVLAFLQADEAADRSAVDSPTGAMIRDLKQTVDEGDWELANAKLTLLHERWQEFLRGGPSPESFQSEVKGLKLPGADK